MARSALCIGLVAVAASAGGGTLATTVDRDTRDAAEAAGRACLTSRDCLRIGARLLQAASLPALAEHDGPAPQSSVPPPLPRHRSRPAPVVRG